MIDDNDPLITCLVDALARRFHESDRDHVPMKYARMVAVDFLTMQDALAEFSKRQHDVTDRLRKSGGTTLSPGLYDVKYSGAWTIGLLGSDNLWWLIGHRHAVPPAAIEAIGAPVTTHDQR